MDHSEEAYCRTDLMTITRHILNEQNKHPEACGDFTSLLNHIVIGCKYVCSVVNKAGLAKLIGLAGNSNVQMSFLHGEEQKKLDVLSNEVFVKALISSGCTCILVSEDNEEAIFVEPSKRGRSIVVFDPWDGSSNIDCGVSIGTLVLSSGSGVNGFTLDPSLGEFILTHPNIKIPKTGKIYSVNEGNARNWDEPTAKYVENSPHDGSLPKSLRYIGRHFIWSQRRYMRGPLHFLVAMKILRKLKELYAAFEDKNA